MMMIRLVIVVMPLDCQSSKVSVGPPQFGYLPESKLCCSPS